MGIDPGLQTTGWAIVTVRADPIAFGSVSTGRKASDGKRCLQIEKEILNPLKTHNPIMCGVEKFFHKKKKGRGSGYGYKVHYAIATILMTVERMNIYSEMNCKIEMIEPSRWKAAFGLTKSGKKESINMAQMLTGHAVESDHVAEAILIATYLADQNRAKILGGR